jgi:hypothetical protein
MWDQGGWDGRGIYHTWRIWDRRIYRLLIRKPEEEVPLRRSMHRCEDNIKIDYRMRVCRLDLRDSKQGRRWAPVNTAMKSRILVMVEWAGLLSRICGVLGSNLRPGGPLLLLRSFVVFLNGLNKYRNRPQIRPRSLPSAFLLSHSSLTIDAI